MKYIIKNIFESTIFECEAITIREACELASKQCANLEGANLRSANLYGASLEGADLRSADLRSANLYGANLYGANLYGASLYGANLRSASLRSASLRSASLEGASLEGASLEGAKINGIIVKWFMILGHCEGWTKTLVVSKDNVAYIMAGCRWFTLTKAKLHWESKREERPLTLAMMLAATKICQVRGYKEDV